MKPQCLHRMLAALAFVLLPALAAAQGTAQGYPNKPLRIVIPFAAGGPADQLGRMLGDRLNRTLGQPVVVLPKEGAGTIVGVDLVAKSTADGYTLLLASDSVAINSASGRKLPYDLFRDLVPITLVLYSRQALVTGPSTSLASVNDLIAAARATPGKLTYGSSGVGAQVHLSTERFRAVAGISLTHVPYKGVAPAMADLLGGHVDMMIANLGFAAPTIRAGKVRALAIADDKRYEQFPEVPTFRERGVDFISRAWYGMLAPKATPAAIVQQLSAEVGKALADPEMRSRIAATMQEPMQSNPEHFATFLREDVGRWEAVIRANKVQFN